MTVQASGSFEVQLNPLELNDHANNKMLGRMSINKQFKGDLLATSQGEMLTAGTSVDGSAGYVAIERVDGTLHGRSGSFVLQHSGIMNRGAPQLKVTVVPDSGTDQLEGIAGELGINIAADGTHTYDFQYTLPALDEN